MNECLLGLQDFFKKHGVAVMTIRELFDFIVDATIADDALDGYLEEVFGFVVILWLMISDQLRRDLKWFLKYF